MLTDVFVGAGALVLEELGVFVGNDRDNIKVRARYHDLPGACEGHDALCNINTVADDIRVAVDVAQQLYRPKVDTNANRQRTLRADIDIFLCGVCRQSKVGVGALQKFPHMHANEEGVLRVTEKAHRRTIAGIENDALLERDISQRIGEHRREAVLEQNLLRDRSF